MGGFVTAPLEVLGPAGPAADAATGSEVVRGRSPAQIAWLRLRRNRVAFAAGVVVVLLVLGAIAAPLLVSWFGHPPEEFHSDQIDPSLSRPIRPYGGISREFLLGVEPINGRDLFSRILYGAQISLLIALLATLLSVVLGVLFGIVAGYFGGWVDVLISRTMDLFLAFPLLLFAIALAGVVQNEAFGLRGNTLHVAVLVFIIGFFAWPYIGRIIRGQTLSLREREFVDAARSVGAGPVHILFRELLPNLWAPIIVYSTLLIPTNILFEAALSFLGVGVHPPTPSWGGMLASAVPLYTVDPYFMVIPGAAIFVTVLAFNVLGDGLREALDPRTR